ncbi:opsin-5-like [Boleophthalmus pectinirostris]|uniref:opsin-5-like n=1 Tax=Boleophthalmus pectinirostris TaxID=150288 RepID=UPI002431789C|nr:opsin-5-like [Boleophthalmus pectinirostris]
MSVAASGVWRNNSFRDAPLSDQGETIIGIYLLLLGWLSWFGNSLVLVVLLRQRSSLGPSEVLTLNLAVSDASIAVFGYSRGILQVFNLFHHTHLFISHVWTCQVDGFLTLVFGLSSINTLTLISVNRYLKGCDPHRAWFVSRSSTCVALVLVWSVSVFWSGAPLFGWGSYRDRGYGTCEVDWAQAAVSVLARSYIWALVVTQFFVPVLVMIFCYVSIIRTVKRGHALSSERDELSDRQRKMERDVTIVSIVICTAFILAWSPYAVVSLWSACGFAVPNLTSIFTRLFAKSASFYNPLIYFGLNSKFRRDVFVLLPCARNPTRTKTGLRPDQGPRRRPKHRPKLPPDPAHQLEVPNPYPPLPEAHMPSPSETGSDFECARLRVFPETPERSRVFPETPERSRVFPEIPERSRVFPEIPERSRVFPEIPERSRAVERCGAPGAEARCGRGGGALMRQRTKTQDPDQDQTQNPRPAPAPALLSDP